MEIIQGRGRKILFASVAVFALFALISGVVFVSNNGTKTVGELGQNTSVTNPTNSQKSVGLDEDRGSLASTQDQKPSKSDQNIDAPTTKSFISRFNLDRRHLIGLAIGGGFLLVAIATAVVVGVLYQQGVLTGVDPSTITADEEEQKRLEDAKRAEEEEAERQKEAEQEAQAFIEQASQKVLNGLKLDFNIGLGFFFATAVLSLIGFVISRGDKKSTRLIEFMTAVEIVAFIFLFSFEQNISGAYMIGATCFSSCLVQLSGLMNEEGDGLETNLKIGITAFLAIAGAIGPIIDMAIRGTWLYGPNPLVNIS